MPSPRSEQSFVLCEAAAQHIHTVAKYVIGTAAAISGDVRLAEQLLLDAEARLKQYMTQAQGARLASLLDSIQGRLRELYEHWLVWLMRRYTSTRCDSFLAEAEALVPKLRCYDGSNYLAKLLAGMAAFVLRRDMTTARREIGACRKIKDATWRYSEAFLTAYEGDLEAAYRQYARAFSAPLQDPTVPTQCEEFIQIVLEAEPARYWLYYPLALINYRAKGDLAAALAGYGSFLVAADATRFAPQIDNARKAIADIQALLSADQPGRLDVPGPP